LIIQAEIPAKPRAASAVTNCYILFMQIKPEQLSQRLKPQTGPFVWISGDETLLVQEACDLVRRHAREQGFTEREVMDAGAGFNWDQLLASGNSMSLFAERKLTTCYCSVPARSRRRRNRANGSPRWKARDCFASCGPSPNSNFRHGLNNG
jgi:hypothetical protein